MQDRVPVNPGRVLVTPENGGAAYYATLTRADNPTQEGTPLNKANLLTDATAALFGLDANAVPNDVLRWVGKYNQHWWARTGAIAAYYTLETETDHIAADADNYYTYYYADSVIVSEDGTVSLAEPISTVSLYRKASNSPASAWAVLTGKFYYGGSSDSIRYMANAPYKPGGGSYIYVIDQEVTGHPQTSDGETVYITSNDRNAYPDNGTVDGLIYQYLGVPFENAVTASKIATGSYTGTGETGEANAITLTFGFEPKMVIVQNVSDYTLDFLPLIKGVTETGDNTNSGGSNSVVHVTWGANSVSWYSDYYEEDMKNNAGDTYLYIAIS